MDKNLKKLLNIFAGEVIPFKAKAPTKFNNIDQFEQHVRGNDLSERQKDVIESIMQTAGLESESNYLDIPEEAYEDLQNYLKNWVQEWSS